MTVQFQAPSSSLAFSSRSPQPRRTFTGSAVNPPAAVRPKASLLKAAILAIAGLSASFFAHADQTKNAAAAKDEAPHIPTVKLKAEDAVVCREPQTSTDYYYAYMAHLFPNFNNGCGPNARKSYSMDRDSIEHQRLKAEKEAPKS